MAESSPGVDSSKVLQISKYSNRRYYDKTRSRHLTLDELYAAIRDGYQVCVTDSKTGGDITPKVLAQIILELDTPKLSVFPVELLHQLLRSNQQLVLDFTEKYFSAALKTFLDSQKKTEFFARHAMGLQPPAPLADWSRLMWGPLASPAWPPQAPAAATATDQQLEQLRQEVKQLQEALAKSKGNTTTNKSKKRKK